MSRHAKALCVGFFAAVLTCELPGISPNETQEGRPGERLPPSALGPGVVETAAQVRERMRARTPVTPDFRGEPRAGQGEWLVPSRRATGRPHSGAHHVVNERGDTRMGIGFPEVVRVRGVWVGGHSSPGASTDGLRAIGYRNGVEVARTGWFEDVGRTPAWFAMDLAGVDRIELVARPVLGGAGWYAIDDLTWERGSGDPVVVDFDDLPYRTRLTGSGYAGLTWETGTGTFHDGLGEPRAIPSPQVPGDRREPEVAGGETLPAGAGTLPDVVSQFNGMSMFEPGTSYIPADTCGAAGPDHFVSVVNVQLGVFDKATGARLYDVPLTDFFGVSGLGDPRVTYDPHSGRWFLLASSGPSTARIWIAISTSPDPLGAWFKSSIDAAQGSDANRWPDYPTLGVDADGFYVAALMVPAPMTIWAIEKAPLLSSTPSVGAVTAWRDLPFEGAIQPCVTYGDSGGELLVSRKTWTTLRVRQVSGPITAPTLSTVAIVTVPGNNTAPSAPALGSQVDLSTGDTRPMNAVYRAGSVYTAHTVNVDGRAGCRWYELDVASETAVQVGTIADPVRHYFYPSIAVDAAGHVVLGCSGSHAGEYAGTWYTGHHALDPPGATAPPAVLKPGKGAYNYLDGNGTNRWGDYSLTSVDPASDGTFWTIQEYARFNGTWGTRIAEIAYLDPCPTPWSTCATSPNSAGPGAVMGSSGSTSVSANDLTLLATGCPPSQFGIFFYGAEESFAFLGNGILCVESPLFRLPVVTSSSSGDASHPLDVNDPPGPAGQITAGSSWVFQLWYRDPAGGGAFFNLSDALVATFCP